MLEFPGVLLLSLNPQGSQENYLKKLRKASDGGSCLAPSNPLTLQPPHLLRHCTAEPFPWLVGLKLLMFQRFLSCGLTTCSSRYCEWCREQAQPWGGPHFGALS